MESNFTLSMKTKLTILAILTLLALSGYCQQEKTPAKYIMAVTETNSPYIHQEKVAQLGHVNIFRIVAFPQIMNPRGEISLMHPHDPQEVKIELITSDGRRWMSEWKEIKPEKKK